MSKQQSGVNNAWDYSKPSVEDYGWHTTERDAVLIRALKNENNRLRTIIEDMISAAERTQRDNVEMAFYNGSARATMKHRAVASRCGMLLGELRKIARAALGEGN